MVRRFSEKVFRGVQRNSSEDGEVEQIVCGRQLDGETVAYFGGA